MTGTIYLGADTRPLEEGWTLLLTEAGRYQVPADLPRAAFHIPASVPGTVAGALTDAGLYDPAHPSALHDKDVWYIRSLDGEAPGPAILRFEGLATIADIFVNNVLAHTCESMFQPVDLSIDLSGSGELVICFRALQPHLERKGPRAAGDPGLSINRVCGSSAPRFSDICRAGARRSIRSAHTARSPSSAHPATRSPICASGRTSTSSAPGNCQWSLTNKRAPRWQSFAVVAQHRLKGPRTVA